MWRARGSGPSFQESDENSGTNHEQNSLLKETAQHLSAWIVDAEFVIIIMRTA
tara:strand:- start:102 stop:260 length:159 start_codon:yes stop_codon:yes gene_type:complete